MTRHQKWSRRKIAVVTAISIPILLFLWMVEEALVGHPERVTVWSCTACLKDRPTVCGVFESNDSAPALDEKEARISAEINLCNKLVTEDPHYDRSVCNDIDERTTYTCSSSKTWRHEGGDLFRVIVH